MPNNITYPVILGGYTLEDFTSTLTTDDLNEGTTNLYFTDERAQDATALLIQNGTGLTWLYNDLGNTLTGNVSLSPFSTSDLVEGARLYWTMARFNTAFATKTTTDLTEGSNLYFTNARVLTVTSPLYVPYTGATADVVLGSHGLSVGSAATPATNGLNVLGQSLVGAGSPDSTSFVSLRNTGSSGYDRALYVLGTINGSSVSRQSGVHVGVTFSPSIDVVTLASYSAYVTTWSLASGRTVTNAASFFASPNYLGNSGTITNNIGFYFDGGFSATGTVSNGYGGLFKTPNAGSVVIALYADGISVGTSNITTAPPANGILTQALKLNTSPSNGYVLKSDASGNGSWVDLATLGVISIAGTTNQIDTSASIGAVTLSLANGISLGSLQATAAPTGGLLIPGRAIFRSGGSTVTSAFFQVTPVISVVSGSMHAMFLGAGTLTATGSFDTINWISMLNTTIARAGFGGLSVRMLNIDCSSIIASGGGSTINAYGIRVVGWSSHAANQYSGFFTTPTGGSTSNTSVYTDNLVIGSSYIGISPPANGAIIQGNVSIGVSSIPYSNTQFMVQGSSTTQEVILANATSTIARTWWANGSNSFGFGIDSSNSGALYNNINSPSAIWTVGSTGNLSIIGGTSPEIDLITNNSTGILKVISTASATFIQSGLVNTTASTSPVYFTDINNSNQWMTIQSTGVGVGTTSILNIGNKNLTIGDTSTGTAYATVNSPSASQSGFKWANAASVKWTLARVAGANDLLMFADGSSINSMFFQQTTGWIGLGLTSGLTDVLNINAPTANGLSGVSLWNNGTVKWSIREIFSDDSFRIGDSGAYQFKIAQSTGGIVVGSGYMSSTPPAGGAIIQGATYIGASALGFTIASTNIRLNVENSGAVNNNIFQAYGTNFYPQINLIMARGSQGSPTATKAADSLGYLTARGYGATTYPGYSAYIGFIADADFTDTSAPGTIIFTTVPAGSIASSERMRLGSTGGLAIATATTAGISLNVAPHSAAYYVQQISGTILVTDNAGTNGFQQGLRVSPTFRPTSDPAAGSSAISTVVSGIFGPAGGTLSTGYSLYASALFTNNAAAITTFTGIYYDGGGSLPGGSIGTHYGIRIALPATGTTKVCAYFEGNSAFFGTPSFGSGTGVMFIGNAGAIPSGSPTGGSIIYAQAGALKAKGSSGTITTLAPASPHCDVCDADFMFEAENEKYGYLTLCFNCLAEEIGERAWISRTKKPHKDDTHDHSGP